MVAATKSLPKQYFYSMMPIKFRILIVLGVSLFINCFPSRAEDSPAPSVKHVIHISVDALGAKYLEKFLQEAPQEFPNFERLIHEGTYTFNARTDYSKTITLPNHLCMITGRPVKTPEGHPEFTGHGYEENKYPMKDIESLHSVNPTHKYTASTFDVVHDHGLTSSLYSGKDKFKVFIESYGEKFGSENIHGRNKIDNAIAKDTAIHTQAMAGLKAHHPAYTFLHYPDPDVAGHKYGYLGTEYRDAVKEVDGYLGDLFRLIESDPQFTNQTIIILSADHGGQPGTKSHGEKKEPYNYTIPFFVWGTGVARGADIYKLNLNTRSDPDTGRPDYIVFPQPIRNGDGGNLALQLLGLPPIPGSSINSKQDLAIH